MKQATTKISLVILAFIISLTGMGVTIANFCCDDCSSHFWTKIHPVLHDNSEKSTEHSCCSDKKEAHTHDCTQQHDDNKKCCSLERQSTTLDSYHTKPAVTIPFTWVENIPFILTTDLTNRYESESVFGDIDEPPKITSPREYLSLIRILII